MLLVVRFWEEFDENRDLARRIVGVFALVVFRVRQNRRHSFTTCVRVLLRDQTRARKKSVIRSTTRDAREKSDEYFLLFFLFFTFFGLSFSLLFSRKRQEFFSFFRSSIRCFQTKIKTTSALCALFLSLFSRITPMNAQKVEQ